MPNFDTPEADVLAESADFLAHFDALPDPRQQSKVIYPLDEVLLLATLAGAETFVDIALFGQKKRELLRRFRPFAAGTPSHDHLGDLFSALDAELLPAVLCRLGCLVQRPCPGCCRHRRQDIATNQESRQGHVAYGFSLCRSAETGSGANSSERKV